MNRRITILGMPQDPFVELYKGGKEYPMSHEIEESSSELDSYGNKIVARNDFAVVVECPIACLNDVNNFIITNGDKWWFDIDHMEWHNDGPANGVYTKEYSIKHLATAASIPVPSR